METDRIGSSLPSLINGVSTQAQPFRLPSQCEIQVNALSSIQDGVSKRPPTEHVAAVMDGVLNNPFIHTINRDSEERYVVIVVNGALRIFDVMNGGQSVPVNFPDGKGYLASFNPGRSFRMTTVADYTFVVNRDMLVEMDGREELEREKNQAIAYIKKGVVGTTYRVMVDDVWYFYTTADPATATANGGSSEGGVTDEELGLPGDDASFQTLYTWIRERDSSYIPEYLNFHNYSLGDFVAFFVDLGYVDLGFRYSNGGTHWRHYPPGSTVEEEFSSWDDDYHYYRAAALDHCNKGDVKNARKDLLTGMRKYVLEDGEENGSAVGTQPSTEDIAEKLAAKIREGSPNFIVDVVGSSILVYKENNEDFSFAVMDSWGSEASMGIKREVQKFQDLPAKAWDGFRVRIVGESPSRDDDYYLEYSSDSFHKNGVWKETRGWEQQNRFDASTMPHTLIREADGTFSFEAADWKERLAGDDYSNPRPSFAERRIEDIFFYRNRLGVIVDENVVLSEAGGFFNFWPDTATSVLATHPIDVAVSNDTVSLLRHAVVYDENLILFADQVQFQLGSGGQPYLSPETVKVDKTTEYSCLPDCAPVHSGHSVFFAAERGDHTGIREYVVSSELVSTTAAEVTSHVVDYLPGAVFKLAAAVDEGILFVAAGERPDALYVYRYFWVGEERVQSCWSHWTFQPDARVLSVDVMGSWVFLVMQYPDGIYLERIALGVQGEMVEFGHKVMLDRKVRLQGVYDSFYDTTSWTFPYPVDAEAVILLYASGHTGALPGTRVKTLENKEPHVLQTLGNHTDGWMTAGLPYEMRYRFSRILLRESRDPGAAAIQEGRLQLLNMTLFYKDSGGFQVEVSTPGRRPLIKKHAARLGVGAFRRDGPVVESGKFPFLVLSHNDRVNIDIVNASHFPSSFQAAEWTGRYVVDVARR